MKYLTDTLGRYRCNQCGAITHTRHYFCDVCYVARQREKDRLKKAKKRVKRSGLPRHRSELSGVLPEWDQ